MGCLRAGRGSYQRMEKEDPEEWKHRRAQFLIYKRMEEADAVAARRRPCSGVRICRLKVRVGRRLSRLRRSIQVTMSGAPVCLCRQVVGRIKLWRRALCGKEVALPLFL